MKMQIKRPSNYINTKLFSVGSGDTAHRRSTFSAHARPLVQGPVQPKSTIKRENKKKYVRCERASTHVPFKMSQKNAYSSGLRNKILSSDHSHYLSSRLRDIIFSLIKPGNNLQINNTDDTSAWLFTYMGPIPSEYHSPAPFFLFWLSK